MINCLNKLLDSGDISETVYKTIKDEYEAGKSPDDIINNIDKKTQSIKKERAQHAYDRVKYKELKSYLDDVTDPKQKEEAIYDLITMRDGMPSKQHNVQLMKEYAFGKAIAPISKEIDKLKGKWGGFKTPRQLIADVGVAIFNKNAPVNAEARQIAESFRDAFNQVNDELAKLGAAPLTKDLSQVARLGTNIQNMTRQEFIDKVSPLVTNDVNHIGRVYDEAMNGEEIASLTFKNDKAAAEYRDFTNSDAMEAMVGYLEKASSQLAQIKVLGVNSRANLDRLIKESGLGPEVTNKAHKILDFATGMEKVETNPNMIAKGLGLLRPIGTASMLGGAAIMTFIDVGTMALTSRTNGIPLRTMFKSTYKMLVDKNDKLGMAQMGFQVDSVLTALTQTSRYNPHASSSQRMNKIATGVLQVSGLLAITDVYKLGFKNSALVTFRNFKGSTWSGLNSKNTKLRQQMSRYDITPEDWDIVRKSMSDDDIHLDPTKLPETQRAKFMRMINEEANYAVLSPGAKSAWFTSMGGQKKGTIKGEIARNITQFKSTIVEQLLRHIMRAMRIGDTTGNKIKYAAEYTVITTLLGGMVYEMKELTNGKEPVDPIKNPADFFANSLRNAGTLPIVTDTWLPYLIKPSQYEAMKSPSELAMGMVTPPTLSTVLGIGGDTIQATIQAAGGDEAKAMKELSQAVRGTLNLVPGSNIWYLKEIYNTYVEETAQKILDPRGFKKKERRLKKEMRELDQDYLF